MSSAFIKQTKEEYKIWLKDHNLKTKNKHEEGSVCAICQEDFKENEKDLSEMDCKHIFHRVCITQWIDTKIEGFCPYFGQLSVQCPVCKRNLIN